MRILLVLLRLLAVVAGGQRKVQIRTYTRKDGTVVQSHTRGAPGTRVSHHRRAGTDDNPDRCPEGDNSRARRTMISLSDTEITTVSRTSRNYCHPLP